MTSRHRFTLALAGLLAAIGGARAPAHDGHEDAPPGDPALAAHARTWTHASGKYHVRGSFVALRGDQVQVRKEDGHLLDIRFEALSAPDRDWVESRRAGIARLNDPGAGIVLARLQREPTPRPAAAEPAMARAFRPFSDTLKLRWDDDFFYVESSGMPAHRMMVGITAWQQQVPIPQAYTGSNAWRIPLHPVPARRPMSAKENFFRGAIALAVNGVPIFNPIKNDGRTDTFLAGELDEFGGHCGRADDYHYHIAPVHLEPKTGKGNPLAYALDGYPIYGYDEPDGAKVRPLDTFNGHDDAAGYHYHATKAYPYLNGGFHGEVTERGGQVDPQPHADPVREALPPLRGARIVDFEQPAPDRYRVTYERNGGRHAVDYTVGAREVTFRFIDDAGRTTTETYLRGGQAGRGGRPRADRPPPPDQPKAERPRRKGERRPPPATE